MKLRFKVQPYQTAAVDAVVDCFLGQPLVTGLRYRLDPGQSSRLLDFDEGYKNEDILLTEGQLIENIQAVQKRQILRPSKSLDDFTEVDRHGLARAKPRSYRPGAKLILISRWRPAPVRHIATSRQSSR